MTTETILVRVPFAPQSSREPRVTWVDIETRKISCAPIERANGEVIRRKWEPILIGTGFVFEGAFWVEMTWGWEGQTWAEWFNGLSARSDEMIYSATREFDEMVLKGRFTNARRAHLAERPESWLGIEDLFGWKNVAKTSRPKLPRGADVESRLVPNSWPTQEREVLVHLFRDVLELFLRDPLTTEAAPECATLLTDFDACWELITRA